MTSQKPPPFSFVVGHTVCTAVPSQLQCRATLIMTEGNQAANTGSPAAPPASRRLTWITPAQWIYEPGNGTDASVVGGISLISDLTRDTNVRAAFDVNGPPNHGVFEPLADGIINVDLSDFDDYAYLTGGMRAALCLEGGTWPDQCVLPPWLP